MPMPFAIQLTDPRDASDRQLLLYLLERFTAMSQVVTDTAAAVTALDAKVDMLISVVTPALATLTASLAAAQAQVASLLAGNAADATALASTIADAVAETAKVQDAINLLTPVTPTP